MGSGLGGAHSTHWCRDPRPPGWQNDVESSVGPPETKNVLEVTADLCEEGKYSLVAKCFYVWCDALQYFWPATFNQPGLCTMALAARCVKLGKALPSAVDKTFRSTQEGGRLWSKPTLNQTCIWLLALNAIIAPVWEILDLLSRVIVHIPKNAIMWFKGISGISIVVGMGHSLIAAICRIAGWALPYGSKQDDVASRKVSLVVEFLSVIEYITYVALGSLVISMVYWSTAPLTGVLAVLSAVNVTASVIKYYWENLGKPSEMYQLGGCV